MKALHFSFAREMFGNSFPILMLVNLDSLLQDLILRQRDRGLEREREIETQTERETERERQRERDRERGMRTKDSFTSS
jgi:hypothetical protein